MPTLVANLNQISTAAHRMFAGQDPKKNCEVLSAWIQRIPISTYRTPFKQFKHRYLLGSSGTKHPFHSNKFPFPQKKTAVPQWLHGLSTFCPRCRWHHMFEVFTRTGKCQQQYPRNPRVVNQQWQDVNKSWSFYKDGLLKWMVKEGQG